VRILIHSINFSPELTGVGKYTGDMAEWLAVRGHEVRVVTAPPHYPQWRIFHGYSSWRYTREKHASAAESTGTLDVFHCPLWIPRVPRGWRRVLHLASFSLCSWPAMLRQLRWKPDVVLLIAPTLFCSPQALCVARLSGSIAWLHVQDFEADVAFQLTDFSSQPLRRWVNLFERFVLSKFDRVSAISDRMVERLPAKGVDPVHAVLFPNWVDTSVIYPLAGPNPLRQELAIPPHAVVALYSGSMGKKQGLDFLVEVSRRLAFRNDIQFVFCGDGSNKEAFLRMAKDSENVIVLPLQPANRLNELLNLADIHLLPQLSGAADLVMPSKLTGMMASGRAIVAQALAGTQLFAALEGRGIATVPGDVDAFVSALLNLADHPASREQMGAEARSYAVNHMNRDDILVRFELALSQSRGPAFSKARTDPPVIESKDRGTDEIALMPRKAADD